MRSYFVRIVHSLFSLKKTSRKKENDVCNDGKTCGWPSQDKCYKEKDYHFLLPEMLRCWDLAPELSRPAAGR